MIRSIAALLIVAVLTSCASTVAKSPAQRAYAAQSDYNAVLGLLVTYETRPRCGAGTNIFGQCSEPVVVVEIRKADNVAYAAVKALQDTVRTPGVSDSTIELSLASALNAISVFRAVTVTYKIGG